MRTTRVLIAGVFALWFASGTATGPAEAQSYPRLGLYGSVRGNGYPYVQGDFALDTLAISRAARYHEIVLDVSPASPYRPDIVHAMKARNPNLRVLAYVLANDIWQVSDSDSLRHIPTLIRRTVRDLGGFLYDANTGGEYSTSDINLAKRGVNGRFVVAEALADIFRDHIIATGLWDGIFSDVFCHTVAWTQSGTGRVIDLARAGYASTAALDAAWAAASDTLAARLRRAAGPDFVLVGNCGPSAQHDTYNGWMRENFPYQQGGSWYSNMLGDVASRGYLQDDRDYLQPAHNWILSIAAGTPGSEYQSYSTARVRFGLASGALGEGVHAFGPGGRNVLEAPYHEWWYDEYAVDLSTGRSSESLEHTGWLGAPLNDPYKMLWTSDAPESITNPGFETDVTSGWLFRSFAPASGTLTRDVTTAAVGNASSKVHVGAVSSVDWYVNFTSAGQLNVFAGSSYSATFWCKASTPRILHLQAGNSRGNAYVAVDTTWRRYQAVLQPSLSMSAGLAFFLGTQAGDVWFDDVHFQPGATSVWRRDFQHGSVLVNPTELALDVALETPFRRILGVHASAVNDGALSATLRLPPYDALFLLRAEIDGARPAAVQDLRVAP